MLPGIGEDAQETTLCLTSKDKPKDQEMEESTVKKHRKTKTEFDVGNIVANMEDESALDKSEKI